MHPLINVHLAKAVRDERERQVVVEHKQIRLRTPSARRPRMGARWRPGWSAERA